ncbi:MAG: hypothetical protein GXO18_06825 [Aquificae bacterium]|nr:hypothetical protein [Aquificota bacterium]
MFDKLKKLFGKKEESLERPPSAVEETKKEEPEKETEPQEEKPTREARPLLPHELETFKKGMGITPHNYWTWASRTNNFKLLTDGEYVWVEGYEDHIGKQLPLTQQRAWSWEFIRKRLQDFGGEG